MAAKKTTRGKVVTRKTSSASKRSTRTGSSAKSAIKGDYAVKSKGSVWVLSKTGAKKIGRHVAKKSSAREIERSVGLSAQKVNGAKSLLARLTTEGLIGRI